jgi:cyclic nucleotide-binding protein
VPSGPVTSPPPDRPCACGHSSSAHRRGACAFCECQAYKQDELIVEHTPQREPDEVWAALEMLALKPAFQGLTPLHLTTMAQRGQKRLLMAGTTLMDKGDSSDQLYLLLKGEVHVERPPVGALPALSADLGPGEIVGEVGLLHGVRHSATVTASTDLRVLEIGREALQEVFHQDHRLLLAFLRMIHHRLAVAPAGLSSGSAAAPPADDLAGAPLGDAEPAGLQ